MVTNESMYYYSEKVGKLITNEFTERAEFKDKTRLKRRVSAAHRVAREQAKQINESWGMDFVSDALFNGRRFRALTIVDNFSRECPAIKVDRGITGQHVVEVLNRLKFTRGLPKSIRVDNDPEFISKILDKWAYEHGVILDFSRPGKPQDNAFVESFDGSFREECLNVNWFLSLEDTQNKIETWQVTGDRIAHWTI